MDKARLAVLVVTCVALVSSSVADSSTSRSDGVRGIYAKQTAGPVPAFSVVTELNGDGAVVAADRLRNGLATGLSLHPPLSEGERAAVAGSTVPFLYFSVPDEAGVGRCYPESSDPSTATTMAQLGRTSAPAWRLGAVEFDQSGGCWAQGRPSFAGLDDRASYDTWMRYYRDTRGLGAALAGSAAERGYPWMSVCAFAFCPQYAFDLGSDAVVLERNNDELSGLSPGLAFVRGAARQNGGKVWGIDLSTYRSWTGGPTMFDRSGRLVTGWSPSTFERSMYAAYMGGADILLNEAADYTTGADASGLNPLGRVVQSFTQFATRRHPDRGDPYVPIAFVEDHTSGYEPRYGQYATGDRTWYEQNAFTPGDRTFDALLALAYPGYAQWGSIPPDAPWRVVGADGNVAVAASQAAQRRLLAGGADPRRWEPMGSTRWGETVDVLTDRARIDALRQYAVVVLSTSQPVEGAFAADLREFVRTGGTLLLTAAQLSPDASSWAGVRGGGQVGEAGTAVWNGDGSTVGDGRSFGYSQLQLSGAQVVATAPTGAPLVTVNTFGEGRVYVSAIDGMVASDHRVDAVSTRLLDDLSGGVARASVAGPPVQYLVNLDRGRTILTLINTDLSGAPWSGTVSIPHGRSGTVREWTQDVPVADTAGSDTLRAQVTVPPYGVRVFAVDTD